MKARVSAIGLTLGAALTIGLAGPASAADEPGTSVDATASAVQAATPATMDAADVPAHEASGGSFAADTGALKVSIPQQATAPITLNSLSAGRSLSVSVTTGSTERASGELATDGSVVYDGSGATDQTVQPTEEGVRIHTVINDDTAPQQYAHTVGLPAGTHMQQVAGATANDPGAVLIVDASGTFVAGFAPPWATDANGNSVPTHYSISGNQLIQTVEHSPSSSYPIVADPWLGADLIKGVRWVSHTEGLTMEVTPTTWARINAPGYEVGVAGWNEIMARRSGVTKNAAGMRDQFICHEQIVALRAPNKPTWNIDEWRPNVGYAQTVNASCNPGGSKWFD